MKNYLIRIDISFKIVKAIRVKRVRKILVRMSATIHLLHFTILSQKQTRRLIRKRNNLKFLNFPVYSPLCLYIYLKKNSLST